MSNYKKIDNVEDARDHFIRSNKAIVFICENINGINGAKLCDSYLEVKEFINKLEKMVFNGMNKICGRYNSNQNKRKG